MNAKKPLPLPAIVGVIVVALVVVGFLAFKTTAGPGREAPSAPAMYDRAKKLAVQSGGDYSKLSPEDQKYLDTMSHGHGQKLLANQFALATKSGGN